MKKRVSSPLTTSARDLRARQTKAESLLWSVLRGRRLCGLKFRRQHPIPPFIADFVCIDKQLIIELDGGYHDMIGEADRSRQSLLENRSWTVLRFRNEDLIKDVDAVAIGIAKSLGLDASFRGKPLTWRRPPCK